MSACSSVEKCKRKRWPHLLILVVIACTTVVPASIAHAASNTDPFAYDPQFNNGVIVEDRFASTTGNTTMLGERVFVSPHYNGDPNGDIVANGQVAVAYQGSPGNNFGSVRYDYLGQRIGWGDPTSAFIYYDNRYLDWPNLVTSTVSRVDDVKTFQGYVITLLDLGSAGNRGTYLRTYIDGGPNTNGGQPVYGHTVNSGLISAGAALVPYTFPTFDGGGNPITAYRLIVVETSTSSSGQRIITMKRYILDIASGNLSVDTSFGTSGSGAVDEVAPNSMCNAGTSCSWDVAAATALRTDTDNPTLYLGGTAYSRTSALRDDGVIVSVNGYDGSLNSSFGGLLSTGYYINHLANPSDVVALAATTSGAAASDVVFVTSSESYTYGACPAYPAAVTKLLAQTPTGIHGFPATAADGTFADNGTLRFGGELAADCTYSTFPADMLVDGNRLVIVGSEELVPAVISASPPDVPLFAIVRTSDGALTDYQRGVLSPLHANGTPWGGGTFNSVALRSPGHYAVTGAIIDASANSASLFGTAVIASDRIFGDDFESP
jgi:hypothetical protein